MHALLAMRRRQLATKLTEGHKHHGVYDTHCTSSSRAFLETTVGQHPALLDQYLYKLSPENVTCSIWSGPTARLVLLKIGSCLYLCWAVGPDLIEVPRAPRSHQLCQASLCLCQLVLIISCSGML